MARQGTEGPTGKMARERAWQDEREEIRNILYETTIEEEAETRGEEKT
jgi:hypothetical protein